MLSFSVRGATECAALASASVTQDVPSKEFHSLMLSKRLFVPILFGALAVSSCRDRNDLYADSPSRIRFIAEPCATGEPSDLDAGMMDGALSDLELLRRVVPHQATDSRSIAIDDYQVDVWRADGSIATYTHADGPVPLVPGNLARIALTVRNRADGWVPINFELCIQNARHLLAFHPDDADLDDLSIGVTIDDPCVVRFDEWPTLGQDDTQTFAVGAVKALDQPGGNYLVVYVYTDIIHQDEIERLSFKIPYRIAF